MTLTDKQKLHKRLTSFCTMMGEGMTGLDVPLQVRIRETIQHLGTTTKVVIAGLSASQHRGVGEFLAGGPFFSSHEEILKCPLIRISHGEKSATEAIFGTEIKKYPGVSVSVALAGKRPDTIQLHLPYDIFRNIDISILPAYDTEEQRSAYLVNLIENTEVVIWCSDAAQPWSPQERRLWFTVPDTLKERSILALTHTGQDETKETQETLRKKLEIVSGEFHTSAKMHVADAKAAVRSGKVIDRERFKSSGGYGLIQHALALVQISQKKLVDDAKALREELDQIPLGTVQGTPLQPLPDILQKPVTASPDLTEKTPSDSAEPSVSVKDQTPAETIKIILRDGAQACREALSDSTGTRKDFSTIFGHADKMLSSLKATLSEADILDRDHVKIRTQITDIAELISLLSYENDENAARDAAAILHQISSDILLRLPTQPAEATHGISEAGDVSVRRT